MQYTLIHVCIGNNVLDRQVFFDKGAAKAKARELIREKIWHIDGAVYFGDVDIKMYDLDTNVTSDA